MKMMNLRKAAQAYLEHPNIRYERPIRDLLDGFGLHHAVWMLEEIKSGKVTGEKGHRWLGYAQGMLVAFRAIDHDEAKEINKAA